MTNLRLKLYVRYNVQGPVRSPSVQTVKILAAVLRLNNRATSVQIAKAINGASRQSVMRTMQRLKQWGYIESELARPTGMLDGRTPRFFILTEAGESAVRKHQRDLDRAFKGTAA